MTILQSYFSNRCIITMLMIVISLISVDLHAGNVTYIYTDPQGTPRAEADSQGNIIGMSDYRPYGRQALGVTKGGPGYAAQIYDVDASLIYMQARYYDPVLGRFITVDPVIFSPGKLYAFNSYMYVKGNPVGLIDPTGRLARQGQDMDICQGPVPCEVNYSSAHGEGDWARPQHTSIPDQGVKGAAYSMLASAADQLSSALSSIFDFVNSGLNSPSGTPSLSSSVSVLLLATPVGLEGGEEISSSLNAVIHGNSSASRKLTYLYRLTDANGNLLKWGLTNNPSRRYTSSFMSGKNMELMTSGSIRGDMLKLERFIVERDPGPLNREPWAGASSHDIPDPEK